MCKVSDIDVAVSDFRELGFTVQLSSKRSKNALIWFPSGPFIELVGDVPKLPRIARPILGAPTFDRISRWAEAEEGWCDFSVETDSPDLKGTWTHLASRGVGMSKPRRMSRRQPETGRLSWEISVPDDSNLPFAMSAYRPAARPVNTNHANGATHIQSIEVFVPPTSAGRWDIIVDRRDPWVSVTQNPAISATTVGTVRLGGLTEPLDEAKLHGAVLTPASSNRSEP